MSMKDEHSDDDDLPLSKVRILLKCYNIVILKCLYFCFVLTGDKNGKANRSNNS